MAEHTLKFPKGTWVKGTDTDGRTFEHGLLIRYDENDGEQFVQPFPSRLDELAKFYEDELDSGFWCESDEVEKDDPPEWLSDSPTHAFVYDWMDDHVPNVTLHAQPQDLIDAYFADATTDERANLQLKLMEAVADPGERIELAPGGGSVRFCVVNG